MVQHYVSPVRIYKYPFELVMAAYEKRFPTCKLIPIFLGSEIQSKTDDGVVEVVHRKCFLNVEAPYLMKKIISVDQVIFLQKNTLDRKSRSLQIEATNETFSSRLVIKELCIYTVHPENPDWTCFEQEASLDVKSFFGFESTVEKLAMKQYTANVKKGKEVIEYYIQELLDSGITRIPTWQESQLAFSADAAAAKAGRSPDGDLGRSSFSSDDGISSSSCTPEKPRLNPTANQDKGHVTTGHVGTPFASKGNTIISTSSAATSDFEDSMSKLDADYIQTCLGDLSPYEESQLLQLRRWIQETHKGKIPKDSHILRFLKARDFNVEKGREMICHSLAWRKLHGIDKLLHTYQAPPTMTLYYPGGWHYFDKDGRPLYVLRLGQMDVKGLLKSVGFDLLQKHILSVNEEGLKLCENATRKLGKPVSNFTVLVDLEGLNMRHLWRPGVKGLLKVIEVVEANYPETMGYVLIVRAPRIFPILWTLVSPFFDDRTRAKFLIYAGKDYKSSGVLADYIPARYLPDFLGGECSCHVPEGGLVPKALYATPSLVDEEVGQRAAQQAVADNSLSIDNMYHTAFVVRDFPHEVLVQVAEKSAVITWDFDVLKGDVTFMLMRCRRSVTSGPHVHHVSGASGGVGSTQYTDKHWVLGVDLTLVEPPLVCRDGDSMQGSHVTNQTGSYILQWKHFDSGKNSFDLLLSPHRSKVMYYTEMLSSERFRGSMSSIQSSQSGFSHLSQTTACGVQLSCDEDNVTSGLTTTCINSE